jgi:hypothetical protein
MTPLQHTLYTICLFLSLWSLSMWCHRRQRCAFSVRKGVAAVFGDEVLERPEGVKLAGRGLA